VFVISGQLLILLISISYFIIMFIAYILLVKEVRSLIVYSYIYIYFLGLISSYHASSQDVPKYPVVIII